MRPSPAPSTLSLLYALHSLYEDLKLDTLKWPLLRCGLAHTPTAGWTDRKPGYLPGLCTAVL